MQNDVMTDKFIDYVNDRIEDLDMTKSSLARSVGLDKNSVTKYLKKERTMPLHVALKIANYLNMDISRICGDSDRAGADADLTESDAGAAQYPR